MNKVISMINYIEKVLLEAYESAHYKKPKCPTPYCFCELNGQLFLMFETDARTARRVTYRLQNNFKKNFERSLIICSSFCENPSEGFTIHEYSDSCICYRFDTLIIPIQNLDGFVNRIYTISTNIDPKLDEDWSKYQNLKATPYLTPHFFNRVPDSAQEAFPKKTFGKMDSDLWYGVHDRLMDEYREITKHETAFGYLNDCVDYNQFCYVWNLAFGYYPKALDDIQIISTCGEWRIPEVDRKYIPKWKK